MKRWLKLFSMGCSGPRSTKLVPEQLEDRLAPSSVPLHVIGTHLENSSGQQIILRGVNVDGMEGWGTNSGVGLDLPAADLTEVDNAFTSALNVWHANLIRLPVNQDFWLGLDPGVNATAYHSEIDSLVQQASNAGAYVVLTMKVSDGGTSNPALESGNYSLPDSNTTAFWASAAQHYASNPAVLFDLFNEPGHFIATYAQWKNGATAGNPFQDDVSGIGAVSYASPGLQGLINTIRSVPQANNIIVAEGEGYADEFQDIGNDISGGIVPLADTDDNLMYSIHIYPNSVPDASNVSSLNNLLPSSLTSNYPIYVGEWGADVNPGYEGAPSTTAAVWNQNMLNWLATKPYSWTAWAMNAEPWLTIQGTTTPTSYFGTFVEADLLGQPTIAANPANQTVAAGQTATFTAAVESSSTATIQWQRSTNGGTTWSNISGAISTTYSFTATQSQNGYEYQAIFTNQYGMVTTSPAVLTVAVVPTVTSVNPSTGPASGGTSVIITGTGFTGATAVKFGVNNATSFTVNSATQITAIDPSGTGLVDVTVATAAGTSSTSTADHFTYSNGTTVNLLYVDVNSDAADAAIYDGGVQRSMVDSVDYHFNIAVNLDASAISITLHSGVTITLGNGSQTTGTVGTVPDGTAWSTPDGGDTWVVTFGGSGVTGGGSIADGVYDITLNAAHITTASGGAVTLNNYNGGVGNDTETFWCLFGDANKSQKVTTQDFAAFAPSYLARSNNAAYVAWFDQNGNNKVTTQDYDAFANNYLKRYSGFAATI